MKRLAVCLFLALPACAGTSVTDYTGDSVTVRSGSSVSRDPSITAEAQRLCDINGKRAEYLSTSRGNAMEGTLAVMSHVFVCRPD